MKSTYYYDTQLKRYILQFMAIFSGLQVQIGKSNNNPSTLIPVDIHYGTQDRVVASIISSNVQTTPLKLPLMSANLSGLNVSEGRMKGTGTERRQAFTPLGGVIPKDTKVIHQLMPVPYDMTLELAIMCSNTDQQFQLLEQILVMFDPQLQIQTTDSEFDWTRLSTVKLTSVGLENNYPIGTDKRIIQNTLTFELPIWIETNSVIKRDFIEQILVRIGMIDYQTDNFDIISELDAQGASYQIINDVAKLPFQ